MKDRLGDLLVKCGAITVRQLESAHETQKKVGGKLGVILVKLRHIAENDLVVALADQLELPCLRLKDLVVSPAVSALLDVELLEKHMILPIRRDQDTLMLAMADPLDCPILDEVRFLTGLRIEIAVAGHSEIQKAIDYYCHSRPCKELEEAEKAFRASSVKSMSGRGTSPQGIAAKNADTPDAAKLEALVDLLVEKNIIRREELEERLGHGKQV